METTNGNVDELSFVKQMYNKAKHLQEGFNKEQNNFVKNQINQDRFYWTLKQKYDKLEKDNEAYRINMRTFQLEYEKMSAQYQEESRLRPEILNKVKATRDMCLVIQEYLQKNKNTQTAIQEDCHNLIEIYNKASEEVKNMTCEMNRLKDQYQTKYVAAKEKIELKAELLKKDREIFSVFKQDADILIQELKSKLETSETNNRETVLNNAELHAMVTTQKLEMQKKEEQIIKLQEDSNAFQWKKIEMELRAQDAVRRQQQSDESIKLMTENLMQAEEKIRNIEEQLRDVTKRKDCSDESAKLISEKLIQSEEKFHVTEKKLQDAEGAIAKLFSENENKDNEIKKLTERITYLNVLESDMNVKENIIKDISDKYNIKINENEDLLARVREADTKIEELMKALEFERGTVSAKMDIISKLMADSKQSTDALAKTELQLNRTQEDLANALLRHKEMETSLKENFQKRVQELENEVQRLRQLEHEHYQRDFFLSPVNFQVPPERQEQPVAGTNTDDNGIDVPPERQEQPVAGTNTDDNGIDQEEMYRRYKIMTRGDSISHLSLSGLRKSDGRANDRSVCSSEVNFPVNLQQTKVALPKEKKFFKHKRSPRKYNRSNF